MFSSTTMLSSTSTPMAVVRAISVIVVEASGRSSFMTISATSSEVGIASSTMIVLRRLCRKKNRTTPVMSAASSSSSCDAVAPSGGRACSGR